MDSRALIMRAHCTTVELLKVFFSVCTSTAGAWVKTRATSDCIALHCTSAKRHFRLLRYFACQSSILLVVIHTSRSDMSLLQNMWGLCTYNLGDVFCVCLLSLFICICYSSETLPSSLDFVLAYSNSTERMKFLTRNLYCNPRDGVQIEDTYFLLLN